LSKKDRFSGVVGELRRQMPLLVLLSCVLNLTLLVGAIYMLQVYDRVLTSGSVDTLIWLTGIAVFVIVIYGILERARRQILSRASGFLERELAHATLKHTLEARLAGVEPKATLRDVADLRSIYQGEVFAAALDAPWSVLFLAVIWLLHPVLGLVATCGVILLLIIAVTQDLLIREDQVYLGAALREVNEEAVRLGDAGETLAPLGMTEALFDRWRARQTRMRIRQQRVTDTLTTALSISRSVRLALQVAILGVGAYLVLDARIGAGAMVAASIIQGRALAPIEKATTVWSRFVAARMARMRLHQMHEGLANKEEQIALPRPAGQLDVAGVSYQSAGAPAPILQSLTFSLRAGETCAIIGPSGSGKTTLCRLIVGAWDPTRGSIRLDGAEVRDWDARRLGPHIGYLPQTVQLFPGTIAENIARFGDLDSGRIIAAAKRAGVHDLILRLPKGYDTEVGQHKATVSLGQQQLICLARAFYGDPSLIVLDEPNSNLDGNGERALFEAVLCLKGTGTTVLVVTHRAQILNALDKVLVLRNGILAAFDDRANVLRPTPQPEHVSPLPKGETPSAAIPIEDWKRAAGLGGAE